MTGISLALAPGADLDGFRAALRSLIAADVAPEDVSWTCGAADLFAPASLPAGGPVTLPRAAAQLIETVVCHRDPERYALLHRLVWRLRHGEPGLLGNPADPLVHRLERLAQAIRRDLHKMHAFVRFRRLEDAGDERFVAWFEPDHFILDATAGFFVERFRSLDWTILTPVGTLRWDRARLHRGPPARREDAPESDSFEAGWRAYYEATFNPARTNLRATRAEMPTRYWRNLPEAAGIPAMIADAPRRMRVMLEREAAMPTRRMPDRAVAALAEAGPQSLDALNAVIAAAEPMVAGGRRAVLGEGPPGALLAFVGEQPGDQEDLEGRPFVGPAGRLLDEALAEAGIDRRRCYLTNAVKHFKFTQRGTRRLHQSPTTGEVKHYRWWLQRELAFVQPRLVVALGATAALALAGRKVSVTRDRGPTRFDAQPGYVTVHPSFLLRLPDPEARTRERTLFVQDLTAARALAFEQSEDDDGSTGTLAR